MPITIAAREWSARSEAQQQVIAVCLKIARKHHRAQRVVASNAALKCVEAVWELLPEMERPA